MLKKFALLLIPLVLADGSAHAQYDVLPDRFKAADRDGDARISREEWRGPEKRFDMLDKDKDGFLTASELPSAKLQQLATQNLPVAQQALQNNVEAGTVNQIEFAMVSGPYTQAILFPGTPKEELREAGMDETGLEPIFPENSHCYSIDHVFGERWKGPTDTLHSGADIPAPMYEPIIAMADGVVIAKTDGSEGGRTSRGNQIVLQHAPADTGLPYWLYTLYSHFSSLPEWKIGQHVNKGEVLGPNGRSGVPGLKRQPHLHLTMLISESARYAINKGIVVPENGRFIDPPAVFRKTLPIETAEMKKLQGEDRKINIAILFEDGEYLPSDSRIVWPFRCSRK